MKKGPPKAFTEEGKESPTMSSRHLTTTWRQMKQIEGSKTPLLALRMGRATLTTRTCLDWVASSILTTWVVQASTEHRDTLALAVCQTKMISSRLDTRSKGNQSATTPSAMTTTPTWPSSVLAFPRTLFRGGRMAKAGSWIKQLTMEQETWVPLHILKRMLTRQETGWSCSKVEWEAPTTREGAITTGAHTRPTGRRRWWWTSPTPTVTKDHPPGKASMVVRWAAATSHLWCLLLRPTWTGEMCLGWTCQQQHPTALLTSEASSSSCRKRQATATSQSAAHQMQQGRSVTTRTLGVMGGCCLKA